MNQNLAEQRNKFFFILLILLSILFIGESLLVVSKIRGTETVKPATFIDKKTQAFLEISLEKDQAVKVNKNLKAQIIFNSPNESLDGADAILRFNPELISIVDIVGNRDIFKQTIINQQQQSEGRIKITAYSPQQNIQEENILAFLTLRVLKNKPATLEFEFSGPGQARDSNLISHQNQQDILQFVYPLVLKPEK